jgi:dihydropteroate synthase
MSGPPAVMGIINVTPDSFSDGGLFFDTGRAIGHGVALAAAGADILDIGGESTRPGASAISLDEELARVIPVIEGLRARLDTPISVDTSRPGVMRASVAAGAGMINDIRALAGPGALEAAATLDVPVCLMHMQGEPGTMQRDPRYEDVVAEVSTFLGARMAAAIGAGVAPEHIIVDPGFGFGKNLAHNLQLLRGLDRIVALGAPVLAGLSRKSMIVKILGREPGSRLAASLSLALFALTRGASILRVHDVRETVEAVQIWCAAEGREWDNLETSAGAGA